MSELPHRDPARAPAGASVDAARVRRAGWDNAAIMRTAALVIGMYLLVQLVWFAHYLVLIAFLGILFGLAIAAGVDRLERWHIRRGVGAALIVIGFFGVLTGVGAWMAPTLQEQSVELRNRLPDAIDRLEMWMNTHRSGVLGMLVNAIAGDGGHVVDSTRVAPTPSAAPGDTVPAAQQPAPRDSISVRATLRDRVSSGIASATRFLFPFLTSTASVITGFLIMVFLAIYIAADPEMYRRGIMQLFPHAQRERAGEVLSAIAGVLRRWLVTQLIAMVVIGVVCSIVLALLGVKASIALGVLAGLLEFVPTVGPILSALPAIAMGFVDSPEKALWVAIAYWAIQFFENHLLIPLLMKGGVDLPPALTILSQALMALLFGFLGLMCAVPLLAATMVGVKMLYVEGVVGDPPSGPDDGPARAPA